ncbi:MAG: hypothetical protein AB7O37_14475 [Vicinamibacteria bacterium]
MPSPRQDPEADRGGRPVPARPLATLASGALQIRAVAKDDLREGDFVLVETRNSTYALLVHGDGTYSVAGGWFDRHSEEPSRVGVNGCTFGGRAIKTDIVAAEGLFLEFDNRVTTTRIRAARLIRGLAGAAVN